MTHVTSVPTIRVVGGIDTHKDLHMAAVVDRDDGRLLETKDFSTTRAGYRALLVGCVSTARSSRSGSKAPAAMAPGSCVS